MKNTEKPRLYNCLFNYEPEKLVTIKKHGRYDIYGLCTEVLSRNTELFRVPKDVPTLSEIVVYLTEKEIKAFTNKKHKFELLAQETIVGLPVYEKTELSERRKLQVETKLKEDEKRRVNASRI